MGWEISSLIPNKQPGTDLFHTGSMLVSGRKNLLRPVATYPSKPSNPIDLDVKQHAESSKPRASCQKWNEISGTPINLAENTDVSNLEL